MDIGNQQRVIIVQPIDIDEVLDPDHFVVDLPGITDERVGESAGEPSFTPTLQTD